MLIQLHKSKLFTVAPETRFGKEYGLPPTLWREMWKRHIYHDHSLQFLCEYFEYSSGQKITRKAVQRWLWRTYVYMKAQGAMKMGARTVDSEFFGNFEQDVVLEFTRNAKSSAPKEPIKTAYYNDFVVS